MGLSTHVYPSATHSRFSHALGALYLMTTAIHRLREKGISISDEEYEAVCLAILLHDIGHGPFSHALEGILYPKHHEVISLDFMKLLNDQFSGRLDMAIRIFKKEIDRPFLHQLVSSQLDMDRLDYLIRDSFHTGVAEGVIGYKRLISMLHVVEDQLVLEEKAIFSIEKFLVARHIMYWQVYLHKTSIVSETLLREFVRRYLAICDPDDGSLASFAHGKINGTINDESYLEEFSRLDDVDVLMSLKSSIDHPDFVLKYLSNAILHRKLHKLILSDDPISRDLLESKRHIFKKSLKLISSNLKNIDQIVENLIFTGHESNQAYNKDRETIRILRKSGDVVPIYEVLEAFVSVNKITKHYLCYPR